VHPGLNKEIVSLFASACFDNVGVQASELELLRVEVNTFFKNDDGNLLIVQEVQDNRCLCKSVRSPEFFTLPIENVRVMAHRYRSGLLGGIN